MHSLIGSIKGLSKLSLLVLLIASAVVGAVLSYLWTEGYYIETGRRVPEDVITITITNVTFPIENSTFFNVTVLNPSFSKADAYITGIALITTVNGVETVDPVQPDAIVPAIPYLLSKGDAETFRCHKMWGHLAGDNINVAVFLETDSGAVFASVTSKVTLEIVRAEFHVAATIRRFNVTVRNSVDSLTPLNVSAIWFDMSEIPTQNVTIPDETTTLPYQLLPGENQTFTVLWNLWETGALGFSHNITVNTLQGYSVVIKTQVLPPEILLDVSDSIFAVPHTDHFNITVGNPLIPAAYPVDISRVTVTVGSQTFDNITIAPGSDLVIPPGTTRALQCLWSWEAFKGQNATLTVHTSQGFRVSKDIQIQEAYGIPIATFEYIPQDPHTYELVIFNASQSFDTYGTIVSYFWDFGDAANSTGELATHSYADHGNYTVTLVITDNDGLTDTASINITVLNQLPVASFTESATTLLTGEIVYFNASDSHDDDGVISSYYWDFGDAANSTDIFVNHTYADDGVYTVFLTVTDDDGAANTTSQMITVLNRSPVASFIASATTVFVNETITFNASTSEDPDGTIVTYLWNFGDGANATGIIVNHAYTINGTYLVILNVTDNDGATTQSNVTINVMEGTPAMTGVATDALSIDVTDPTAQLVSKDLACQVTLSKR
jgi:PKD repeat protein